MKHLLELACLLLLLPACTVTTFRSNDDVQDLQRVCIIENPDVEFPELLRAIESRMATHSVESQRVSTGQGCEHTLEYAATQSSGTEPYLTFASFTLRQNSELVNTAKYRDRGGPPEKRAASLSSKIDPIVDELLGFEVVPN